MNPGPSRLFSGRIPRKRTERARALTLIETLVVLAVVLFLASLLLPALFRARSGPGGPNCVNNLKQVGLAWLLWVNDHDEASDLPFRISVTNGGTQGSTDARRNNAWWQYCVISNELDSPRFLVCPADKRVGLSRRPATNWSATDPTAGFMSGGFRDCAVSYTIGLDARPFLTANGWGPSQAILGSDRNIRFDSSHATCSAGLSAWSIRWTGRLARNPPASAPWTNAIHGTLGNIVCLDGSVHQMISKELDALLDLSDDNGSVHFLVPK